MNLKRILTPTDFSNAAREAIDFAADLAGKVGAEVYLLHVFESPALPSGRSPHLPPEVQEWIAGLKEENSKRPHTLAEEVRASGVRAHPIFKEGNPLAGILGSGEEIPAPAEGGPK